MHKTGRGEEEQLYWVALKCAYFQHVCDARVADASRASRATRTAPETEKPRETLDGLRCHKDVIKQLKVVLETIAKGANKEYKEPPLLLATFKAFYAYFIGEKTAYKNAKEDRRLESIILMFYSRAIGEAAKSHGGGSSAAAKTAADMYTAKFVALLRTLVGRNEPASRGKTELLVQLAEYQKKFESSSKQVVSESAPGRALQAQQMRLVMAIGKLFNVSDAVLQRDVDKLRDVVTAKNALHDLQIMYEALSNDAVLGEGDFSSLQAYSVWKLQEEQAISQLAQSIIVSFPDHNLTFAPQSSAASVRSGPPSRSSSMKSTGSNKRVSSLSVANSQHSRYSLSGIADGRLTLVPEDPAGAYRGLIELALAHFDPSVTDLKELIPKPISDLLSECCVRWRVRMSTRVAVLLGAAKDHYLDGDASQEVLQSIFKYVAHVMKTSSPDTWCIGDCELYVSSLTALSDSVFRDLYQCLSRMYDQQFESPGPYLLLEEEYIMKAPLFDPVRARVESHCEQLVACVKSATRQFYLDNTINLSENCESIDDLVAVSEDLSKKIGKTNSRFKFALFGRVDVAAVAKIVYFQLFAQDFVKIAAEFIPEHSDNLMENDFEAIFLLNSMQRRYLESLKASMITQKSTSTMSAEETSRVTEWIGRVETTFRENVCPILLKWLDHNEGMVLEWVKRALEKDRFITEEEQQISSSVVDLFHSVSQSFEVIGSLDWPLGIEKASVFTKFSRIVWKAIVQYAQNVESMYANEMLPPPPKAPSSTQEKLMTLAKDAINRQDKVEPIYFSPESCVKINNIEFARDKVEKLESNFEAPKISEIMKKHNPEKALTSRSKVSFVVKVIGAEDLKVQGLTGSCNPYAVLSVDRGKRVGKTRLVQGSTDPRWDGVFEIQSSGLLILTITIWHRDRFGEHHILGRCHPRLDPKVFSDLLPRMLWLELDVEGRVLIRVNVEGEKNDALFYFGRSYRALQRAEDDMINVLVTKMSPYIHQCLSLNVLKGLSGRTAISQVSSLFGRTSLGTRSRFNSVDSNTDTLADTDIEAAIAPLLDYFDANFGVLKQSLSPNAFIKTMSNVWDDVLYAIESIMLPPLRSGSSNAVKQLSEMEMGIAEKWIAFEKSYFYADGDGVPLEILENSRYELLTKLPELFKAETADLMEQYDAIAQSSLKKILPNDVVSTEWTTSSFYRQGTIRSNRNNLPKFRSTEDNEVKWQQADVILRVIHLRPRGDEFIQSRLKQRRRIESLAAAQAGFLDISLRR